MTYIAEARNKSGDEERRYLLARADTIAPARIPDRDTARTLPTSSHYFQIEDRSYRLRRSTAGMPFPKRQPI